MPLKHFCHTACLFLLLSLVACAAQRAPIAPGVIPEQHDVSADDEKFGHDVLSLLTRQYPLDRDDSRINRVRDIADRLTGSAQTTGNPWHIYVLNDDSVKNAAATRGNYIFVWTGMLNTAQGDEELAAVLAHEIGHVLAGHTKPTPMEEVNSTLAGVGGTIAREVVYQQGIYSPVAQLAGLIMSEAIKAMMVNPEEQRKELEADQIGLFLIADAGYDPESTLAFWEKVKDDPDFAGLPFQFLSSHPSTDSRIENLRKVLPLAMERYSKSGQPKTHANQNNSPSGSASEWTWNSTDSSAATSNDRREDFVVESSAGNSRSIKSFDPKADQSIEGTYKNNERVWIVSDDKINIFADPSSSSQIVGQLVKETAVVAKFGDPIKNREGRWLEITNPMRGFVKSTGLSPQE